MDDNPPNRQRDGNGLSTERERPAKLQPDYVKRLTRTGWWGDGSGLNRYDPPTTIGGYSTPTPNRERSPFGMALVVAAIWLAVLGGIFWASYVG